MLWDLIKPLAAINVGLESLTESLMAQEVYVCIDLAVRQSLWVVIVEQKAETSNVRRCSPCLLPNHDLGPLSKKLCG